MGVSSEPKFKAQSWQRVTFFVFFLIKVDQVKFQTPNRKNLNCNQISVSITFSN